MDDQITFLKSQISGKGKAIIKHLDHARRMLLELPFDDDAYREEARQRAQEILISIIYVAGLCCGSDEPSALHGYLTEAGIEVPQEFLLKRQYFDSILEDPFADGTDA